MAKTLRDIREQAEIAELMEKLTAADPTGKWISDFVKSDNPKFAGKSKKERIKMALGAAYAAQRQNEEVEIDEAVEVLSHHYEFAHGKRPSGHGHWMFTPYKHIDFSKHKEGEHYVSVDGKYGEAKKKAQAWAKSKGHSLIKVAESVEQLDEVGDTKKGQKLLRQVNKRAVDRLVSKKADKDPAYARKAMDTHLAADSRLKEEIEELEESAARFIQKVNQAANAAASGKHKNAQMHLDNARTFMASVKSTDMSKIKDAHDTYKNLRKKYAGSGGDYKINDDMVGTAKVTKEDIQGPKWKVTYDIHGSNRNVPLYTSHKHVYAKTETDAIHTIKSLVGGRNHKAELVKEEVQIDEADMMSPAETYKKLAVKHLRDSMNKSATQKQRDYAKKMNRRALEASKMDNHTDALNHYRGMSEEFVVDLDEAWTQGNRNPQKGVKVGSKVRSYDFPGMHDDHYIEGHVIGEGPHSYQIKVNKVVRSGKELPVPAHMQHVEAPKGRGMFSQAYAVHKILDKQNQVAAAPEAAKGAAQTFTGMRRR